MAITTNTKINYMLNMDKADGTVRPEYRAPKSEHNFAIINKKMKKVALDNALKDLRRIGVKTRRRFCNQNGQPLPVKQRQRPM